MRAFPVANAVVATVNALVWVGLAFIGGLGLIEIQRQHDPGYPNRAQLVYYLGFPLIMAACALALYAVARLTRFGAPALLAQVLVLVALLLWGYG